MDILHYGFHYGKSEYSRALNASYTFQPLCFCRFDNVIKTGGVLGLIFAGYVLLASQSPYPILGLNETRLDNTIPDSQIDIEGYDNTSP